MPTAIFLSRVSAANAFCLAICDPEFEGSASILKPDAVQACQSGFQSIINAFQASKDAVVSISALDLQRFTTDFDCLRSDLNVHISALVFFSWHLILSCRWPCPKSVMMRFKALYLFFHRIESLDELDGPTRCKRCVFFHQYEHTLTKNHLPGIHKFSANCPCAECFSYDSIFPCLSGVYFWGLLFSSCTLTNFLKTFLSSTTFPVESRQKEDVRVRIIATSSCLSHQ